MEKWQLFTIRAPPRGMPTMSLYNLKFSCIFLIKQNKLVYKIESRQRRPYEYVVNSRSWIFKNSYMKVIEGSNDMRSIKSVGKFNFRWTRFVKHLNGDVFFPTFMQFFVQGIVQPFGLMDTLSFEFSFF